MADSSSFPYPLLDLDPSPDEWRALVEIIRELIEAELGGLENAPIASQPHRPFAPEDESDFSAKDLASWLRELFASGLNTAHPGFMAFIPGGGLVTSALAEWLIKSFNRYGTARFAAPRLARLEHEVIQTFARWVGYGPEASGVLTTGGSLANFTAIVTARRAKLPEDFLGGVLYCSDQTHHSVMKAANLAGFSRRNLRMLPSDTRYWLDVDALAAQIRQDRRDGLTPFLVVASAGTTNTGSIDPLEPLSELCAEENLWYHIDAAYGGAFVLTERGKARLQGLHTADSITLDPHKGLFLPYGTGSLLVKDAGALIQAHEMRGDYMPDLDDTATHYDPLSLSVELSREHRGLKVWLPLKLHGEEAFEAALDEKLDLAEWAHQELNGLSELEVLNRPELTTVVFRVRGNDDGPSRALMERVNGHNEVLLSGTVLGERFALRLSILSHRTHHQHVARAVDIIRACLAER